MNTERAQEPIFAAIKTAWRAALDALGGGAAVHRADILPGCGEALLSRYGLKHETCVAPLDVAFKIDRALVSAGDKPLLLATYADALGYAVVPKAEADALTADLVHHLGTVAKETSEAVHAISELVLEREPKRIATAVAELTDAEGALAEAKSDLQRLASITVLPRRTA